jgi:NAD(P)H-dependent flavin oxidoreductase YrpB (nitropropane dioxygenase family)
MRTKATELVGADVPIFAFSHCRDVVAAVTNAGGCGVLGAVAHGPEQLDIDLRWIEDQVGGRPYGVDLLVPERFVGADEGGLDRERLVGLLPEEHRQFVDELLTRYGVPPVPDELALGRGIGGMRVDPKSMAPLLDVCFDHTPRLVASALGPPPPHFLDRAHDAGIPVAALAGSVHHARRHADAGADLIVAQGTEAGGHTGLVATMVLVPEVVDAVAPLPVLAAGGIGNGRQLAAGMALGADGAWCGSVWLTTEEAEVPPVIQQKFLAAGSGDTVRSRSMTGKPARMLRTAWTDEWERPEGPGPLPMPMQPLLIGPAMARIGRVAERPGTGAHDLVTYFVGQVVGSMNAVRPARRVVLEMVEEFIDAVERLGGLLDDSA